MKLLLDVYKGAAKDLRDKVEVIVWVNLLTTEVYSHWPTYVPELLLEN